MTRPDGEDGARGGGDGARGGGVGARGGGDGARGGGVRPSSQERDEAALELARVRDRIDELDRRIVELLNERARLGRTAGRAKRLAGRRAIKDPEREREVLLRVAMANPGPLAQGDLLSIYRRIVSATRGLESRDRSHDGRNGD